MSIKAFLVFGKNILKKKGRREDRRMKEPLKEFLQEGLTQALQANVSSLGLFGAASTLLGKLHLEKSLHHFLTSRAVILSYYPIARFDSIFF